MIRCLGAQTMELRSRFLWDVRRFFHERGYLEVETPLLNPTGGFEPFLDPLSVVRSGVRKSPQAAVTPRQGYLITSPEYNLKILVAELNRNLFQIAHVFREGDHGDFHSEEFLMLEWYHVGIDEFQLMNECRDLITFLSSMPYSRVKAESFQEHTVNDLLKRYAGCAASRTELEEAVVRLGLTGGDDPKSLRYDELFFTVFLNTVEQHLGRSGPEFVHSYPPELAALSRVESGVARRFEIYWDGVELANGFFELNSRQEQEARFLAENQLRQELGKPTMEPDEQFLDAVGRLPKTSGIALGLERLLMVLLGKTRISDVSPFAQGAL
ncbi:MAG: EF-P lysine aminoacylase GenX [Spirochaetia bacterium]|nr:EF-P lysine aminoacylase GenX [Spirochaetia bacterium]